MKLNNKQFNKFLGKKIKQGRKKVGVSQQRLAKILGFSRIALSTYESGRSKFTVYQLMLTAEALNLPLHFFLPKSTTQTETKTYIPEIHVEEDTEFILELSLRSYLLSRKIKKNEVSELVSKLMMSIEQSLMQKV